MLPNVQVPFCHCQHVFFFGPADEELPLLFPLDESLLLLLPFLSSASSFLVFHSGIIDFLGMTVKTFVTFIASTFVEEVIAKDFLLVSGR